MSLPIYVEEQVIADVTPAPDADGMAGFDPDPDDEDE